MTAPTSSLAIRSLNVNDVDRSIEKRSAAGKAARSVASRAGQAEWQPSATRPDPVALLESQAESRVQELVPVRYGRMLVSPFTFFRGAALIMASDLSTLPRSGFNVQACGDAHLSNFGVFGSAERSLVFDLNDFDETLPGPWEWDVKRLAASLAIAGRDRGFSDKERADIVIQAVAGYRNEMVKLAGMSDLDVWYARMDVNQLLNEMGQELGLTRQNRSDKTMAKIRARADKELAKARTRDSMQALDKLTEVVDGNLRFVSDPPLIVPVEELAPEADSARIIGEMEELLRGYSLTLQSNRRHLLSQFRFVSIARKVVGVGSVGTRAWVVLMVGSDGSPLLLQAKEAQESVLAEFVGKGVHTHQGERVVAGQLLMQASSDIFLGWERLKGIDGVERDFYIRQLRDWKGSADTEVMIPRGMGLYGQLCGWTLARAHARSGDRVAIAGYLGSGKSFDNAMALFAEAYADQNERDYLTLKKAEADGRIEVKAGL
jgi:uncharacterized protein (DUF2252 family)